MTHDLHNLKANMLDLRLSDTEIAETLKFLEGLQEQIKEDISWEIVKKYLTKKGSQYFPFPLHLLLYKMIYPYWNQMPAPAWFPSQALSPEIFAANEQLHLKKWIEEMNFKNYAELHHWSSKERLEFWKKITIELGIAFDKPYKTLVDFSEGLQKPQWFPGAKMNIVNSCFSTARNKIAIIEGDEFGNSKHYTYQELQGLSCQVAASLKNKIKKGDSIAIIMPMHFRAVAIYLGVVMAGARVVSIAESFSESEIDARLKITCCHWVFTQHDIIRDGKKLPLLEKIINTDASHIIVLPSTKSNSPINFNENVLRNKDKDKDDEDKDKDKSLGKTCIITWESFLLDENGKAPTPGNDEINNSNYEMHLTPVSCDPMDPINILFSSGTTGDPKAIPWNHTTPIKCASDAYFHHNIQPGDRLCWPSSLGWMMGPWSIFAALINRATLALYTGSPNGKGFGEFVQNNQITILGVVPTLVKHWHETHCMEKLNWDAIKVFTSTGECSNTEDMLYLMYLAGYRPILEYCGGTEIGGAYITGTLLQPCAPATFTTATMGMDFVILDEDSLPSDKGEIAIIPPSIGLSTTLLNHDHQQIYYANMPTLADGTILRRHGDQAERYQNGFFRLLGRVDDTMNLSGIKISAAEIEHVLNLHPLIFETAAIAVPPAGGGPEQLIVFVVLKQSADNPEPIDNQNMMMHLKTELQNLIKEHLNPLFKIQEIKIIDKLPRTTSNKVMRRMLRNE